VDINSLVAIQLLKENQLRYSQRDTRSVEPVAKSESAAFYRMSGFIGRLRSVIGRHRPTQCNMTLAIPAE
jgi:hypothetical protein